MKKSFSMLITIFLITLFSYISIFIIETKTLSSNTDMKIFIQTQANMHMNFAKELILASKLNSNIQTLTINIKNYDITAYFTPSSDNTFIVNLYVTPKMKDYHIRLHQSFVKPLI